MTYSESTASGQWSGEEVRHFSIAPDTIAQVKVTAQDSALRVLGDPEANTVTVRAVKPNGQAVPLDLISEIQMRVDGEISIRVRSGNEIRREIKRTTKNYQREQDDLFNHLGHLRNLNDVIDTLTALKTLGNRIDNIRLEVTVPRRTSVSLSTSSGAIQVGRLEGSVMTQTASGNIDCANVKGKLVATTMSGNLQIGDITGTASVKTASGNITTRRIDGNLVMQTLSGDARNQQLTGQVGFKSTSGDLTLREGALSGFYVNTTSGDCLIDATLNAGDYEARTVSGDITLRVQPTLSARLSGRTVSGSLHSNFPYHHADDDWRNTLEDDTESGFVNPEISLGNMHISGDEIRIGDFLHIDQEGVQLPGFYIATDQTSHRSRRDRGRNDEYQRERRRSRNRWEYLIGDPAAATASEIRLRVRTVSGNLVLRPQQSETNNWASQDAATSQPARTTTSRSGDQRSWPDSELWPTPEQAATASATAQPTPSASTLADVTGGAEQGTIIEPTGSTEAADLPTGSADTTADTASAAEIAQPTTMETTTNTDSNSAPKGEPTPPVNREQTRLDILKALQQHEISTDEALALLRQVDA